jgi:hypothetical protein
MTKKRPVGVTVFAILNLVFGGLGLTCNLCNIVFTPVLQHMQAQQGGGNETREMEKHLAAKVPGFKVIAWVQVGLSLLLSSILVIAGIGLLRMNPASRWLCVCYSVMEFLVQIAATIYTIGYVSPAVDEWAKTRNDQLPPGFMSMIIIGGTVFAAFLGVAYAAALLIYVLLPATAKAFAANRADQMEGGFSEDDDGSDFQRRRRDLPSEE